MTIETIEQDIIHFLLNNIVAPETQLNNTTLLRDVGIDSFSIVEIILFIERKHGVIIPDEHLVPENFRTVKALATIVVGLVK